MYVTISCSFDDENWTLGWESWGGPLKKLDLFYKIKKIGVSFWKIYWKRYEAVLRISFWCVNFNQEKIKENKTWNQRRSEEHQVHTWPRNHQIYLSVGFCILDYILFYSTLKIKVWSTSSWMGCWEGGLTIPCPINLTGSSIDNEQRSLRWLYCQISHVRVLFNFSSVVHAGYQV